MKILKFSRKQTECGYEILKFLGARRFSLRAAESRFEILKFLNARHFGSHKQAAEFLKFAPELPRNRSKILKFTPKLRNRFGILEFIRTSARLVDTAQNFIPQRGFKILKLICEPLRIPSRVLPRTDKAEAGRAVRLTSQHTHDATEKRHAVKFNHAGGYLNSVRSVRRRIARLCSAAARHGYGVGRAENFSKFDLTGALLNFISLPSHKFKPASIPLLNFISNFTPHASASKFENGVKFKGATKFKRGAL